MSTYSSRHRNITRRRGAASLYDCDCGARARHWHDTTLTGKSENPDDYDSVCEKCHNELHKKARAA